MENDDIHNMRQITIDLGKTILEKKESIGTTAAVMTYYGNFIDDKLKVKSLKKNDLIG